MPQTDRFSVSLDTELLAAFDRHIASHGYDNRSEAVRDMIRDLLVTSQLSSGNEAVVAILTVLCDQAAGEVAKRLRASLAEHRDVVCGTLYVPVEHTRDALAIALRGSSDAVRKLADEIQAMRGVSHGRLSMIPAEGP